MEKASDGSFARITRKTAEDDDDDEDWGMALRARSLSPSDSVVKRSDQASTWRPGTRSRLNNRIVIFFCAFC